VEDLEPSLEALLGVQIAASALPVPQEQLQRVIDFVSSLPQFRDQVAELRQLLDDPELDVRQVLAQVESLRDGVVEMQTVADMLDGIPTQVLVSPLKTEVENVSLREPDYVGFYAPAVLALLVQHMAVTFGSLTMVRERLLGTEELFRVAPIDPWEIITGKYLGYSLLTAAIGGALSYLIVVAMKVPLFGRLSDFALVLALLAVASLGWGFLISLLSSRESQSVQFSMLILVASVFFGGFFIPLSGLRTSVHFVSYALPVTYGVQALREIMLAGRAPGPEILLPLAGLSLGFYSLCTLIYIRQNRRE
jgi:ABC-2 type transport system permease protein